MLFSSPTILYFKGIPIRMHWTLPVLMLLQFFSTPSLSDILFTALLFAGLMIGVTLHELGHCVVALHKGFETRDILLTPIGGIARIEAGPFMRAREEIQIAAAGPIVSLFLALLGLPFVLIALFLRIELLAWVPALLLLIPNLALGLFNLLPAFPMDGGRILRAALTPRKGATEATRIAARTGQILAGLLFLSGIFNRAFTHVFIGIFIFYAASRDLATIRLKEWVGANPNAFDQSEVIVGPAPYDEPAPSPSSRLGQDFLEVLKTLYTDLFTSFSHFHWKP